MKLLLVYVSAFMLAYGVSSCQRVNDARDRYYNAVPTASMLIGLWEPDIKSLEKLQKHGFPKASKGDHKLILYSNYTCHFESYLNYLSPDIEGQELTSGEGTWDIGSEPSLVFGKGEQTVIRVHLKNNQGAIAVINLNVSMQHSKLVLWNYIGDPDNNEYIDFTLQN